MNECVSQEGHETNPYAPSPLEQAIDHISEVHAGAHEALLAARRLYATTPKTAEQASLYRTVEEAIFRMLSGGVSVEAILERL